MWSVLTLGLFTLLLFVGYYGHAYLTHGNDVFEARGTDVNRYADRKAWLVLDTLLSGLDVQMPALSAVDRIQYKPTAITLFGRHLDDTLCTVLPERFQRAWVIAQCDKQHFVLHLPVMDDAA